MRKTKVLDDQTRVGVNYHSFMDEEIYSLLRNYGFVDGLKFPGRYCNWEEFNSFASLARKLKLAVDWHGLPNFVPRMHEKDIAANVDITQVPKEFFELYGSNIFSTHIGADPIKYDKAEWYDIVKNNYNTIKKMFADWSGMPLSSFWFLVEMQPGYYKHDVRCLEADFINSVWSIVSGGIFDMPHAMLAAIELESIKRGIEPQKDREAGLKFLFEISKAEKDLLFANYCERLDLDRVKILHISGNMPKEINPDEMDAHVLVTKEELQCFHNILPKFKYVDSVYSEYAFCGRHGINGTGKEICIEMTSLTSLVRTRDYDFACEVYDFVSENMKEDCTNAEKVLEHVYKAVYTA